MSGCTYHSDGVILSLSLSVRNQAHFVVGDWRFRVLVYPFGVDNPTYSLCNNSYMSVYLHYLGRADDRVIPSERIVAEFRCTIHSCLGSQHDLYQELQHKFAVGEKSQFLAGFSHFLPLSLLFRTPFYLFPDPNAVSAEKEKTNSKDTEPESDGNPSDRGKATKRNMAILKTELWIFPPLHWHKKKAPVPPKEVLSDSISISFTLDLHRFDEHSLIRCTH